MDSSRATFGTLELDIWNMMRLRISDYKFLNRNYLERKSWVRDSIRARWRDEQKEVQLFSRTLEHWNAALD